MTDPIVLQSPEQNQQCQQSQIYIRSSIVYKGLRHCDPTATAQLTSLTKLDTIL